ncbi:amino acid adenylation domain-containing protein [Oxalobacteraceae bacterium GrIS 1.11]
MDIQDTIVELFENKRIDKAAAYRLLSESKKAGMTPARPEAIKLSFDYRAQSELDRLAAWAYFIHILGGVGELTFDYLTPELRRQVKLSIHAGLNLQQLQAELARQLAGPPSEAPAAPFAWLAPGAIDRDPRQLRASCGPEDAAGNLALELCAEPALQNATHGADWPDTIQHVHDAMRSAPGTAFAELDLLPARHLRLLQDYNATYHYLPPDSTLPAIFEPLLEGRDEATAVQTSRASHSYLEYRQHAYRLAHLLRQAGAARNDMVAVMLHRSVAMPATLYGVIAAGAAYVPLEPDLPWERVRAILNDTGARILVTDADTLFAGRLELAGSKVRRIVCIDGWARPTYQGIELSDRRALAAASDKAPARVNRPHDLAYVLFTSGSTGAPKGVMVSHQNMANSLIGINHLFNLRPDDRIMCFSSYGFDLSVWDLFGSILAGASVFVPSKLEIRDPFALMGFLREAAITVWNSAPTGMQQLLLSFKGKPVAPVEGLRLVLLGGEFIQPNVPADLLRLFPNCRLANMGGATEATIYSNYYYPVTRFEPHWKSIPYGRPLANQRLYVLNEALKPCSIGEKGMIYYGGLSLARGYHGDAEKTRQAFIAAPWPGEPGGRIYRTGDLGIMRADGQMEICGRADQQVKVRGFRVELGDIESQMGALPGIEQAVVIVRQDENMQARLIGFYISARGEIGADLLRTQLGARLPEYMIPSQFVHLSDPPVSSSGKLDRKALKTRAIQRDEIAPAYTKPSDAMQQSLAVELARILKLDRVGVDDDFFLIGGDSLISLQYMAALAELGFKASPLDILQGRTIRGVLERVSQNQREDSQHDSVDGVVPPGPMLRRFFERLPMVERKHWNQMMVIGFDHQPDVERLNRALQTVFRHHALLRASYRDGAMVLDARPPFKLAVIDLQKELFFRRAARFTEQANCLHASVGLHGEPLANAALILMGAKDARLIWVLHHSVVDANCWRILIDDLGRAYRQADARLLRSAPFADYVAMVRAAVPAARQQLAGQAQFGRMPVPCKSAQASNTEGENRTLFLRFSNAETDRTLGVIRPGAAANLNFLLLTSLSIALRRWAGQEVVRFDVISNGRSVDPSRDYSRTIGWFATHNPFEVAVPNSPQAVLSNVIEAWQAYQEHSRFFVAVCNDVAGDPRHPLGKQVDQALLYSHLGDFDSLDLPLGWSVRGSAGRNRGPGNPRTHELEWETMIVGGRLMVRLVYGSRLLTRGMARQLLRHFKGAMTELVAALESAAAPAETLAESSIESTS